jgi:hypothetical protein
VKGDAGPLAKAYAEYYKGCLRGNIDRILPFIAEKERKKFEGDIKENREAIIFVLTQRPSEVEIGPPVISGNSASFTIHGSLPSGEEATGSVKMILEDEKWKVSEDKWKITLK